MIIDPVEEAIKKGKEENKPVLIDFTADWCSVCVKQDQIIERVIAQLENNTVITKIDLEENQGLAEKYDLLALPAVLVYDQQGNLTYRSTGKVIPEREILQTVAQARGE